MSLVLKSALDRNLERDSYKPSLMGIDIITWRVRIGLFQIYHPVRVKWRSDFHRPGAIRWGVGEVMNSTPMVLQGCLAVVALSLILEHTFQSRAAFPKQSGGCGKLHCPKLNKFGACSVMRVIGETGCVLGSTSVCVKVATVVLALLLMAGDVERNPGPETNEGTCSIFFFLGGIV